MSTILPCPQRKQKYNTLTSKGVKTGFQVTLHLYRMACLIYTVVAFKYLSGYLWMIYPSFLSRKLILSNCGCSNIENRQMPKLQDRKTSISFSLLTRERFKRYRCEFIIGGSLEIMFFLSSLKCGHI